MLRDRQLYDLFKAAAARGLRVLFIADACHAGTFTVSPSPLRHMTVFNLSADGTAQFLFPRDAQEAARGTTLLGFGVHEPFEADFAVFVASDRRPAALHALFARSDADPRTASAPEVLEALREDLRTTTVRIGIQGLYTCRKLMENGRCDSMLPSSR